MIALYKKTLLLALGGIILNVSNTYAACQSAIDCTTLGYTMSETECSGLKTIKCPFDTSKVFCRQKISRIVKTCDKVGDILYGSGKCAIDINYLTDIPIGIVFDTERQLAIALTNVKKDGSAGDEAMIWSSETCDIPNLANCTESQLQTCGTDGKANTDAILASSCSGIPYAANAANLYTPEGCSQDFCKKGKWFLPSIKDLTEVSNHIDIINNRLKFLETYGASPLLAYHYLWSSNESDTKNVWDTDIYDVPFEVPKNDVEYAMDFVRPAIKY